MEGLTGNAGLSVVDCSCREMSVLRGGAMIETWVL
jgi:hypothetical protein